MAREINANDSYLSRLLEYIPSEIVMVYIAIEGVLRGAYASNVDRLQMVLWILVAVLTLLTPCRCGCLPLAGRSQPLTGTARLWGRWLCLSKR